jgi:hypothetical protein
MAFVQGASVAEWNVVLFEIGYEYGVGFNPLFHQNSFYCFAHTGGIAVWP